MCPRGKEQRHHDRVPGRVTLRTVSTDLDSIEMETDNLSLGGAYCLSPHAIPAMTQLRLNIFLPSRDGRQAQLLHPIQVDAVVVRSEPLNGRAPAAEPEFPPLQAPASRSALKSTPVALDTRARNLPPATEPAAAEKPGKANGNAQHAYRLALFFAGMDDADREALAHFLGVQTK